MTTTQSEPMQTDSGGRKVLRQFSGYCCEWRHRFPSGLMGNDHSKLFEFLPGAFDAALSSGREIIFSVDLDRVARASTKDGTLKLESDAVGLLATVSLIDTPLNRELSRLIGNNRVRGWSFMAQPLLFGHRGRSVDGVELTEHFRAGLSEVCLVIRKRPRATSRQTPIFTLNEKVTHAV